MLTQKFLTNLEWHLSKALSATGRYWCDGVLPPEWESDYTPEHVAHSHQLILRAWIDEGRSRNRASTQVLYGLVLHLGPSSLRLYLQKQELLGSVIERLKPEWVTLEPANRVIVVQLP